MSNSTAQGLPIPQRKDGWVPTDIGTTPGGQHLFATTPGGTRILWTRDQMLHLAHSPLSKSPLNLPPELAFLTKGAPLPNFDEEVCLYFT
jgi:hypothetical protein